MYNVLNRVVEEFKFDILLRDLYPNRICNRLAVDDNAIKLTH